MLMEKEVLSIEGLHIFIGEMQPVTERVLCQALSQKIKSTLESPSGM
jgi:hypothetical protein